ncbi:MAG: DUF3472 domain-containing protein [Marinilabiliaceae bacterium]|nr:DUF3472 domain-containing protein [Marinilabiliaceae bacterium]
MNILRKIVYLAVIMTMPFLLGCTACSNEGDNESSQEVPSTSVIVPVGGNSWMADNPDQGSGMISENGLAKWDDANAKVRIYFKLPKAGELHVALNAKVPSGSSKIKCTVNGKSEELRLTGAALKSTFAGTFTVDAPGYHFVELQGVKKEGSFFAEVKDIYLGGEATSGKMYFVNEEFYWGRRGPSVHLNYDIPAEAGNVEWFYNEITVPEGNDVIGSYYMANGFGEGYFGMQVNSDTERRVLFSVWSPFKTDDPSTIPDDYKIILLEKGEGVTIGEFGNEGSGGQSYLKYNWKAGNTYRFLLRGKPVGNDFTQYTAYFFAPEVGEWKLIASFKRPHTSTWLTHQYSFLENFHTETGAITRKAFYNNQWVRGENGKWYECTKAKFTADATAKKESRMDYAGGVEDGKFFMQNCGFFNETTTINSYHTRTASGVEPDVEVTRL